MLKTRKTTEADAELIAAHRHAMFAGMGKSEATALDEMRRNFVPWVEHMIGTGKYVGWIVEENERPVASSGFFEPEYRGRGLARELVREGLAESRRRGIWVTALHASDAGRRVYEPMGFKATNEMYLI